MYGYAHVPVIAMTGNPRAVECVRDLFDAVLPKPFLPGEVTATIDRLLQRVAIA
jgi:CheY-like chemotaxis protein